MSEVMHVNMLEWGRVAQKGKKTGCRPSAMNSGGYSSDACAQST